MILTDYIFGTDGSRETLKVKSESGTDLMGWQQHVRETDVDVTTDTFYVTRKRETVTGVDGAVYDFYDIDRHNRVIDKTPLVKASVEANSVAIDDIIISMLEG